MVNRWCKECQTQRQFNVFDVYNSKKKRVVCGHCGTVLMTEEEVTTFIQQRMSDMYC